MKVRELDLVAKLLRRLLESWGVGSVCDQRLRKAYRELMDCKKKGGPVPAGTVVRIVTEISEALCEELLNRRTDERK